MKFRIEHSTQYKYRLPVFPEPQRLRFIPIQGPNIRLLESSISVSPQPAGMHSNFDAEGNPGWFTWFVGSCSLLQIQVELVVELFEYNPLSFIVFPFDATMVPFNYPDDEVVALRPYLAPIGLSTEATAYGKDVLDDNGQRTIDFLIDLCKRINHDIPYRERQQGMPFPPDSTLKADGASCRDMAWMFVAICRGLGLASRFVSGYYCKPVLNQGHELHAWAEVYLPGAGWLAFDPTGGIMGTCYHVAVAKSAEPFKTLPIEGTYRGGSESTLFTSVNISEI